MKIKVSQRGGERQNLGFYKEALEDFLTYLIPAKYLKKLKIKLILAKHENSVHLDGNQGTAYLDGKTVIISVDRRIPVYDILLTLAHEATHCKQFVTGKLQIKEYKGSVDWIWNGISYGSNVYDHATKSDNNFLNLPWEAEAVKNEKPLVKRFLNKKFS
jgi:hypothetical protein